MATAANPWSTLLKQVTKFVSLYFIFSFTNFTSQAKFNRKFKDPKPRHEVKLTIRKLRINALGICERPF